MNVYVLLSIVESPGLTGCLKVERVDPATAGKLNAL
jgi:hypothetical protein